MGPERPDDEALTALARGLAGDAGGAASLLAAGDDAVDRRRPRRTGSGGDDPDPDDPDSVARSALLRAHLSARRPRTPTTAPTSTPLADPELETVRQQLDALDPLPRAVLVLRHLEERTLADVARLTDRSGPALRRAVEAAAAVPVGAYALDQVLAAVGTPERRQVESARRELRARRRRLRSRWTLAALTVVVLVTAATVLPAALRPDPYARAVGAWVYGYEVHPTSGLRVVNRFLTPETDTVRLVDEDPGQVVLERRTCDITATSSNDPVAVPEGRSTRVGTAPGRYVAPDLRRGTALWWRTTPRLALEVSCTGDSTDADLQAVAAMVAPTEVPVLLPVDLTRLPAGDLVQGIYDIDGEVAVLVLPPGETVQSPNAVYVSVGTLFGVADPDPERTVRVGAVTAQVDQRAETETICWDLGGPQACVATPEGDDGSVAARQQRFERLLSIARTVRTAPGTTDRSTWFDARAAVPG